MFIRVYHIPTENEPLKDHVRDLVGKMKWAADLVIIIGFVNLITNIITVSAGCPLLNGRRIVFSILSKSTEQLNQVLDMFMFPPVAHLAFYYGLYGIL